MPSAGAPLHRAPALPHLAPPAHALTLLHPPAPIRSITRQHLADYIATNYTAPRMVISAAGAVDHDALVKVGRACGGAAASVPLSSAPSGGALTCSPAHGRVR